MSPSHPHHHHIPPPSQLFLTKKSTILSSIATHSDPEYIDKSPKGTIDAEIIDLIDEINAFEGYVTTSSCAGRVAVFVEGRKRDGKGEREEDGEGDELGGEVGDEVGSDGGAGAIEKDTAVNGTTKSSTKTSNPISTSTGAGPGGKGHGNKWLYVSHEPIPSISSSSSPQSTSAKSTSTITYHDLFNLAPPSSSPSTSAPSFPSNLRLIKLTFSPLILHILCSSLYIAKPLLAAAINAGFRESGVQSLKILEQDATGESGGGGGGGGGGSVGVMVAIRTAGCGFESVVGYVEERNQEEGEGGEVYRSVVSEEWLAVLVGVCSGRFEENMVRRERLRGQLRGIMGGREGGKGGEDGSGEGEWEDKEARWRRKKEEGLRIKREKEREEQDGAGIGVVNIGRSGNREIQEGDDDDDGLGGGLFLEGT